MYHQPEIAIEVIMSSTQYKLTGKHAHFHKRERGVSLIEVLVSIVVLSIGLLGIAGLQSSVARFQINTFSRAAMAGLYSDIADRIRVNTDVAGGNFITNVSDTASQYILSDNWATQKTATLTTPSPNCETAVCTTSERSAYDMMVWRQRVRTGLPQGAALLTGDRRDGITVTLMWYDKDFRDKGSAADSALMTSAACTGAENGLAQQTCCPAVAAAPAGVRCAGFSFIP